jgi:hypothetical protein
MSEAAREAAPPNANNVTSCRDLFISPLVVARPGGAPHAPHTTSAIVESPSLHAIKESAKQTFFQELLPKYNALEATKASLRYHYRWYPSTLTNMSEPRGPYRPLKAAAIAAGLTAA